ncbi:MAG: ABC transporter ATP-binding protein [Deltaproteobacteria bacterium]|nr:ABC transporter ATP-binding protein [Deltaproteobacteria bacterium]
MLDRLLGKEIAKYVRKYKLLMLCAILPACIAAILSVAPAEILPSFIDNMTKDMSKDISEGVPQDNEPVPFTLKLPVWDKDASFPIKLKKIEIIEGKTPNSLLILLSLFIFISVIVRSFALYLSELAAAAFTNRAINDIRIDLYKKFTNLHLGFYHEYKIGELISRSTADLTLMQASISNIIIGFVQYPLTALFLLLSALKLNYKLTLVVMIVTPLIIAVTRLFGIKVKKHSARVQDATAQVTSAYQETLLCLKVVQGFCTFENHSGKFKKLTDFLYKKTMHWNRWVRGIGPIMDAIAFTVLPVILIAGKTYYNLTLGELVALFYALSRAYSPVKNLSRVSNEIKTLQGATERVFSIINTRPEIAEKENAVILPRHNSSIEFKDVCFSYKNSKPVLKNVSFRINAGEMVAFVGSTGAGKSTLMDLVPRFYDVKEGQILIDGIDIRDVTLESLRRQIGIVSQEVLLFHDTILNNINCTGSSVDTNSIIAAATSSHAHNFIMDQPKQYETIVGDRGSLLSGGQKQRISIARAILVNPSILLLDEVASALDAESEELIQKSIESLKGRCTIFAIAHRLSTIRNADRIFVLEKGEIVESGSHKELMDKNGRFRQLYDMQFHA